jgi:hypothetical protein
VSNNAFRRGVGYALEASCSDGDLRHAMGHEPGSWTCWKHNKSQTATKDLHSILGGQLETHVTFLNSMSLGRVEDARLKYLPWRVTKDPEFILALTEVHEALDKIIQNYEKLLASI